jgi:hypothetical protein
VDLAGAGPFLAALIALTGHNGDSSGVVMIKSRPLLTTLALFAALASSEARANLIVFEPDDFAVGSYVSTINPLVSLWTFASNQDTSHVPVFAPVTIADCVGSHGCASTTGRNVFRDAFGRIEAWGAYGGNIGGGVSCFRALGLNVLSPECSGGGLNNDFNLLLMRFASPTDFVRISGAYANNDFPLLFGFDESFNAVGTWANTFDYSRCALDEPEYCESTVSLMSQNSNIHYALAGGWSNGSSLDNLQFRSPGATSVPEPGAFAMLASGLVCMVLGRRRKILAR